MCLEAPAPKLLLLICNPLRAGGKGIRGISGLTVTTTIISSGCWDKRCACSYGAVQRGRWTDRQNVHTHNTCTHRSYQNAAQPPDADAQLHTQSTRRLTWTHALHTTAGTHSCTHSHVAQPHCAHPCTPMCAPCTLLDAQLTQLTSASFRALIAVGQILSPLLLHAH